MTRKQGILAGVLVLQVLLILLVRSPFADAKGTESARSLLPELETLNPSRLQFEGEDDRSLTLNLQDGEWVLEDIDGYPADGEKVGDLIDKLEALTVRRPVVSSDRYHKTFEIADDEHRGRVRVFGSSDGDPDVDLVLGSSPNYRALHVRRADDDRVYEIRGLATYDVSADASFWAEKQMVEVPEDELIGIRVSNPSGSFDLSRGDDGTWSAAGSGDEAGTVLDPAKVAALLRAARSIRIDQPIGRSDEAAQGLGDDATVVELRRSADGASGDATVSYRIGAKVTDKDSHRYISRDDFGYTGTIWESSVGDLLVQTLSELVAAES